MKKILIVHPALVIGGAETVLINYLNILASNDNYEIDLLLMKNRYNHNIDLISKRINIDYILTPMETEFFIYSYINYDSYIRNPEYKGSATKGYYSTWLDAGRNKISDYLSQKINSGNYDLIIDFHRNIARFDLCFNNPKLLLEAKVIRWVHSQFELNNYSDSPSVYQEKLNKYNKLIFICKEMEINAKKLNISINSSDFIYNPQDIDLIKFKMNQYLSEHDELLMQEDYLVQVSRLDEEHKNHLQLIDIFYQLKQKGIKEKLYIIGEGNDVPLRKRIEELGLQNECLLLGSRNNPYPFMKNAKLFLHTAKMEGFGMVLSESMICNTPVVSFACPVGPSEILGEGKYGELIPAGNSDLFIEKTYNLLNNPAQIQYFKTLLPEAVERFSFKSVAQKLFTIIDDLVDNN